MAALPSLALGMLVFGGLISVAHAHLGHIVARAERYLKIEAGPEQARVVVSLTLGAGEMAKVLMAADREGNGDGVVTDGEAATYLEGWGEGLEQDLPIELDGDPVDAEWGEGYLAPLGRVRATGGAVEMTARVPWSGGRHVLTLRDRMRPEAADRTDVAFRAVGPAELVASGMAESPSGVVEDLAYGPPVVVAGNADAITAVVEVPGLSRTERIGLVAGALGLLAGALASWWALRRRRQGKAPG